MNQVQSTSSPAPVGQNPSDVYRNQSDSASSGSAKPFAQVLGEDVAKASATKGEASPSRPAGLVAETDGETLDPDGGLLPGLQGIAATGSELPLPQAAGDVRIAVPLVPASSATGEPQSAASLPTPFGIESGAGRARESARLRLPPEGSAVIEAVGDRKTTSPGALAAPRPPSSATAGPVLELDPLVLRPADSLDDVDPGRSLNGRELSSAAVRTVGGELPASAEPRVAPPAPVAGAGSGSLTGAFAAGAEGSPALQPLSSTVGSEAWSRDLQARVTWMVRQEVGAARLQLNPPDLGPIQVHISVNGDHAQIAISAHHAMTRDALEASADRLRDALHAEGFTDVDVDVGDQRPETGDGDERAFAAAPPAQTAPVHDEATALPGSGGVRGLVDQYV